MRQAAVAAHFAQLGATELAVIDGVGPDGVAGFERVPVAIRPPPEQRPVPLEGAAAEEMLAYFDRLDRLAADDEAVARNWREIALRHLETYLNRAKEQDVDDLLEDTLGRLLLVAENRNWVDEVFAAVQENWGRQAARIDPLHRPQFAMMSRKQKKEKEQRPRDATRGR